MLDWAFLVASVIVCCEMLRYIPLVSEASALLQTSNNIVTTLSSSNISDHWKEIVIPRYAAMASLASLKLLIYLILVASPILVFLVIDGFIEAGFDRLLFSIPAIAAATLMAVLYLKIRTA